MPQDSADPTPPLPPAARARRWRDEADAVVAELERRLGVKPLDRVGRERALRRWAAFLDELDPAKIAQLDALAAGGALKAVAAEHGLSYEALHKRLHRWRQRLGLRSTADLLYLWTQSRDEAVAPHLPTLLRCLRDGSIDESQEDQVGRMSPAAFPAHVLTRFAPPRKDSSRRAFRRRTALALLSPIPWSVLLEIGVGEAEAFARPAVLAAHETFLTLIESEASPGPIERAVGTLHAALGCAAVAAPGRNRGPEPAERLLQRLGESVAPSLRALRPIDENDAPIEPPRLRILYEPAEDEAHAGRMLTAIAEGRWERILGLINDMPDDLLWAPRTGLALTLAARRGGAHEARLFDALDLVLATRRRMALEVGVHPMRLLVVLALRGQSSVLNERDALLAPDQALEVDCARSLFLAEVAENAPNSRELNGEGSCEHTLA